MGLAEKSLRLRKLQERALGWSDTTIFVLVALAVLALGFVFAYPRQWTRGLLINDETWYAHLARNVWLGNGYLTDTLYPMQAAAVDSLPAPEALKQSGYSLLTALVWTLTGPSARAMVAVALVGFAAASGLAYLLGRALGWGRFASLWLAGLFAVSPAVLVPSTAALPESSYVAIFLLTVLLVLRRSGWSAAGCGLAHAALLIVKGHGVIYVPVYLGYLLLAGDRSLDAGADAPSGSRSERGRRPAWRAALGPGLARRRLGLAASYGVALAAGLLAAWLWLPTGSVQLFRSGGNYSLAFLIDTAHYPADRLPYYEIEPPNAFEYILDQPAVYAEKYLRMVSRTKVIVEALGGPALGGVLFVLLFASLGFVLADVVRPGWLLPPADSCLGEGVESPPAVEAARGNDAPPPRTQAGERRPGLPPPGRPSTPWAGDRKQAHLLFIAIIAVTLLFFWAIHLVPRFLLHAYPLMLLIVFEAVGRLRHFIRPMAPRLRTTLVAIALVYTVAYPAALLLWQSYRDPYAHLGRLLAVRFADYSEIAEDVADLPPGPVISDMAHEINWYTGRPTILFPLGEGDLRRLVDKYDVVALYEHPMANRDWAWVAEEFRLVDDRNGRFWIRRGSPVESGQAKR